MQPHLKRIQDPMATAAKRGEQLPSTTLTIARFWSTAVYGWGDRRAGASFLSPGPPEAGVTVLTSLAEWPAEFIQNSSPHWCPDALPKGSPCRYASGLLGGRRHRAWAGHRPGSGSHSRSHRDGRSRTEPDGSERPESRRAAIRTPSNDPGDRLGTL